MSWWASLRQWFYPKEFRIAAPVWPAKLRSALEHMAKHGGSPAGGASGPAALGKDIQKLIGEVATGLWRLRKRMTDDHGRPREEMRRAYRDLESTWDALVQSGVEVLDHTGEAFDSGLSLSVIAFQPTAGLLKEKILETIKPTVYFRKQRIQMGEVIVGMPETPVETKPAEKAPTAETPPASEKPASADGQPAAEPAKPASGEPAAAANPSPSEGEAKNAPSNN